MTIAIDQVLKTQARNAMLASAKRMSDLYFFEGVLKRLKADEDLSKELPALKRFKKTEAVQRIQSLIKRCKADLKQGHWTINSKKVTSKVKTEIIDGELVPRYKVEYRIQVPTGYVVANVRASGVNIDVEFNTQKCQGVSKETALDQANDQLVLASLRVKKL